MSISDIIIKHPDRVPVTVKPKDENAGFLDKARYLVPKDMTLGTFVTHLRKRMTKLKAYEALFIFCGKNVLPPVNSPMDTLYREHADNAQMLYLIFAKENTFG